MARRDRKCLCCGTEYKYCYTCGIDRLKPTWMTEFCSEVCKELFETATKYNLQKLTKAEAKEIIEKLELKERSEYVECVQKDLEVIMAPEMVEEKPVVETAPILEEMVSPKKNQKSHEVVRKEEKK